MHGHMNTIKKVYKRRLTNARLRLGNNTATPANQTSSILRQIDVVLIGISWIIGLTSGTDVGPMSEKHIELTSEADFGPMSDKPLSDEFR